MLQDIGPNAPLRPLPKKKHNGEGEKKPHDNGDDTAWITSTSLEGTIRNENYETNSAWDDKLKRDRYMYTDGRNEGN